MTRARSRAAALVALFCFLPLLHSCQRIVLDERFHNKRLTGWTVVDDPDTIEGPSLWRVEDDGWVHQKSNIWGKRGDFIGRWYGTYLVSGDQHWRDYLFTVRAKPIDNDGFGVVFRWVDGQHFYRLLFVQDELSGGPITRLDKRTGHEYTEIWSSKEGFKDGVESIIEVEVTGGIIRGTLNGRRLFEARDHSYRAGKIGLFCFAQSDQAFDDVKVILK